nr:MAG TPA: Regulatory protein [Caudoviricetes sp.]
MFVRLNKIMENIILKLMKENNVTQYKLAKETGIAQSTLSY